jgi:hypothetical protein
LSLASFIPRYRSAVLFRVCPYYYILILFPRRPLIYRYRYVGVLLLPHVCLLWFPAVFGFASYLLVLPASVGRLSSKKAFHLPSVWETLSPFFYHLLLIIILFHGNDSPFRKRPLCGVHHHFLGERGTDGEDLL